MVCTTVEKSSSLVYCLTDRRSKISSRGSGRRAFSNKARVMTDSGVPWAKRSKRGSNSMPGSLGGLGDNTQTTYQEQAVRSGSGWFFGKGEGGSTEGWTQT